MHQLTGIVIDKKNASTLEEAQAQAEKSMDDYLCSALGEKQGYFDWYANHSEGRWSNDKDLEPVMDLATDKGMKVYNRLKENNLYEQKRHLEKIKEIIATKSDEEILNSKDWEANYHFRAFGSSEGLGNYLYDSDGCGLDNWWEQEMMKTTDDKWLVLFDCHN